MVQEPLLTALSRVSLTLVPNIRFDFTIFLRSRLHMFGANVKVPRFSQIRVKRTRVQGLQRRPEEELPRVQLSRVRREAGPR